jgi:hypothetical protein
MENKDISSNRRKRLVMERKGKIEDLDRSFDIEFWQAQDSRERFSAAWELVLLAHKIKGNDVSKLGLQRHIENFQRQSS